MAIINRDDFFNQLSTGVKWEAGVAFNRKNPLPIDDKSVFESLEAAQTYAQSATAYPGQVIAVVTASETTFYGINQLGELQDLGGSTAPMQFVANESEMLALQDIEVGQQVYREDTHTVWIFKGGDASNIGNWVESASNNDVVWYGTQNKVIFYALTQSQFDGIPAKDANTVYFLTDSGKVYKGDVSVTDSVLPVSSIPEVSAAIKGKLYINSSTLEAKVTTDGTSWISLSPGYITDGGNWAETTNDSKLGTIAVIKQIITQALATINTNAQFENSTGTLTVGSGTGAVLTGVAHDPTVDGLKLTIPVYGGDDIVLDVPKDKFVTAGQYYAQYPEEEPEYYNVIVLTIENQVEPVIIPAEALVQVYTANNEGKNVVVTVDNDGNTISANITIDPVAGNALTYSASGFKVDISGKIDVISSATGNKVALTTAAGGVSESTFDVVSSGNMGELNTTIPTANLIAAAIASAVNTINSSLDGKLDKLSGSASDAGKIAVVGADGTTVTIGSVLLSDLATTAQLANKVDKVDGTENDIVVFGADGAISDSDKTIGGTTLSADTTGNIVATEAAVNGALSWKQLG